MHQPGEGDVDSPGGIHHSRSASPFGPPGISGVTLGIRHLILPVRKWRLRGFQLFVQSLPFPLRVGAGPEPNLSTPSSLDPFILVASAEAPLPGAEPRHAAQQRRGGHHGRGAWRWGWGSLPWGQSCGVPPDPQRWGLWEPASAELLQICSLWFQKRKQK